MRRRWSNFNRIISFSLVDDRFKSPPKTERPQPQTIVSTPDRPQLVSTGSAMTHAIRFLIRWTWSFAYRLVDHDNILASRSSLITSFRSPQAGVSVKKSARDRQKVMLVHCLYGISRLCIRVVWKFTTFSSFHCSFLRRSLLLTPMG